MARPVIHQHWRLWPHRSLSAGAQAALLGGTATLSVVMAGALLSSGLWPAALFTAIPPVGLPFGIAANNRAGRAWQDITLTDRALIIRDYKPAQTQPVITTFPAGWLRVEIIKTPADYAQDERVERIVLHGQKDDQKDGQPRSHDIGAFLPPIEKAAFARELQAALRHWPCPNPPQAPHPAP